jgi:pyridoxal phosphate enzyme (YggS family)
MIQENLEQIRERIARAAERAGRAPSSVTLIAVSKTVPVERIREAAAAGQRDFGENYVQEMTPKIAELAARWHFIGHLQRNKAKDVAGKVALVHTVDTVELAQALGKRAASGQDVLAQVNLAGEATKSGVSADELPRLIDGIRGAAGVRLVGLMTIPPPGDDNRARFRQLAELARTHGLAELSMGMSDDFETAIEEGATLVRVGTAIFGARAPV